MSAFLSATEELALCIWYTNKLVEIAGRFQPPPPASVLGTAVTYLKRFYLNNSVMDYHPKDIMLVCLYMACKVEEYNVTVEQFVQVLPPNERQRVSEYVLRNELMLLQALYFHLTVHNPCRPLEGFLIDIKTRSHIATTPIESLRASTDNFLQQSLFSDVCLLFAPSQIALAGLLHSGSQAEVDLKGYVSTLVQNSEQEELLQDKIKMVISMVSSSTQTSNAEAVAIQEKLQLCRNQEFNPESQQYREKLEQEEELPETL